MAAGVAVIAASGAVIAFGAVAYALDRGDLKTVTATLTRAFRRRAQSSAPRGRDAVAARSSPGRRTGARRRAEPQHGLAVVSGLAELHPVCAAVPAIVGFAPSVAV